MNEQITVEELDKASRNVQRLFEFIGERRDWVLASDAEEAAASFAEAARSLSAVISDLTDGREAGNLAHSPTGQARAVRPSHRRQTDEIHRLHHPASRLVFRPRRRRPSGRFRPASSNPSRPRWQAPPRLSNSCSVRRRLPIRTGTADQRRSRSRGRGRHVRPARSRQRRVPASPADLPRCHRTHPRGHIEWSTAFFAKQGIEIEGPKAPSSRQGPEVDQGDTGRPDAGRQAERSVRKSRGLLEL